MGSNLFGQIYNGNLYTGSTCGFSPVTNNDSQMWVETGYNFTKMFINSVFTKTESTNKETTTTAAKTPNADKIAELKEKKANIDKTLDEEQPSLKEAIVEAEKNLTTYNTNTKIVSDCTAKISANEKEISKLEAKIVTEAPKDETEAQKIKREKNNEKIQRQIDELKKKNEALETSKGKAQEVLDDLGDPETELAAAKEVRENAKAALLKEINEEIEKLEKEDGLYTTNQELDAALDGGDSTGVGRMFSPKARQVNNFSNTKNELVNAIKSGNVDGAKVAAEKLTTESALPSESSNKDRSTAIELAQKYLNTNKKALELIKQGKLDELTDEQKMQLGIF